MKCGAWELVGVLIMCHLILTIGLPCNLYYAFPTFTDNETEARQHRLILGYIAAPGPGISDPKAHALHRRPCPVSRWTFGQDLGFATLALLTFGAR